ncbi:DNA repair protein RAD57 [Colletotrichum higginsianum]|nr:DNA repair protein RAD57 [Colletotrichum higginsianum]
MAEHLRSSMPEPPGLDDFGPPAPPALALDHQQRWFTGWGDDPFADYGLKTPSLGLVWSTQIACRIALFKKPVYGATGQGLDGAVEFAVTMAGLKAVKKKEKEEEVDDD